MTAPLNIVWFKRDLRVADHRPLAMAARLGPVLPLYIVEPDFWTQPDASARQWAFVAESLEELRSDLAALGQPLCIMAGDAVTIFRDIHQRHGIASLWSHEETGNGWTFARDLAVGAWAREQGIAWHEPRQFGVIRRLPSRDGWANAWDSDMAEPVTAPPKALIPIAEDRPHHIPSLSELGLQPDPCPRRQRGGRAAALATLESFLDKRGRDYRFRMSSPVTAFDACSRLSPHLTWGTISMREVAQATVNRIRSIKHLNDPASKNWWASLISFMGRLHWHCHFMQKLEDEPRLEFQNLHRGYDGVRPDLADEAKLAAWCTGQTGFPFIDACMRALDQHGWINFRMRAMLMSFASYDLAAVACQRPLSGAAICRLRARHPLVASANAIRNHRHQYDARLQPRQTGSGSGPHRSLRAPFCARAFWRAGCLHPRALEMAGRIHACLPATDCRSRLCCKGGKGCALCFAQRSGA